MKNKTFFLNTALAVTLGCVMLVLVLMRAFLPALVLPKVNVPNVVLVCLIALLLDYYVGENKRPCILCVTLLAMVTFGVLPWAAGFVAEMAAVKLGVVGGLLYTLLSLVFTSMKDRITTGTAGKLAPILSAVGIFLASQCMVGILL